MYVIFAKLIVYNEVLKEFNNLGISISYWLIFKK